jgi:hypothetical protein
VKSNVRRSKNPKSDGKREQTDRTRRKCVIESFRKVSKEMCVEGKFENKLTGQQKCKGQALSPD